MENIFLCVLLFGMVFFSYVSLQCEDIRELNTLNLNKALRPQGWKQVVYYFAVPLFLTAVFLMLSFYYGKNVIFTAKRLTLVGILLPIAVYDYREFRIPNKLLLTGLLFRVALIFPEFLLFRGDAIESLLNEAIAAVGAVVICVICMLVSQGSMGMGDLKLMAVMAAFLGIEGLCYAMVMSIFFSFICAVILLVTRKMGRKDVIPFAPFILAGTVASIILSGT